jgi:hypothetical protein
MYPAEADDPSDGDYRRPIGRKRESDDVEALVFDS